MNVGWNEFGVKWTWGEMNLGWNEPGVKWMWGEMTWGEMIWGEMNVGWNDTKPIKITTVLMIIVTFQTNENIQKGFEFA